MGRDGGEIMREVNLGQSKPHVVLLTIPALVHMLPNLALGMALARHGVKVTLLSSGVVSDQLRHHVEEEVWEELDMTVRSVVEARLPEPENVMNLLPWLWKLSMEDMVEQTASVIRSLSPPPCTNLFTPWGAMVEYKLGIPNS